MTHSTPSYYQDLNTLVRFLTRADEGGYVFAVAEHQGMIPQINDTLLDKVKAQGKSIHTFDFDLVSEDSIMEQLREYIENDPPSEALIIKNLDDCLRQRGNDFLQELNFSREALHQLDIPLVFWVSKDNLARISNQAADLFSQRRLTTVIFEADEALLAQDGHLESRFQPEHRNLEDYEALTLKVNLLKKQLQEAETGGYTLTRIARDIALPLAKTYSELDLHQPALDLLRTYVDALPEEDADQLMDIGDIYYQAKQYESALSRYQQAIQMLESKDIQSQRLSYAYNKIGDLYYELGNFVEAENWFNKDITLSEVLVTQHPSESSKNNLAIAYERLGKLYQAKGDFNQALDFFQKYNQLCLELYESNQQNENLKFQLSVSYERLGDLWQNKGDFNQALAFFEKRAQLSEELYQANPHSENLKNGFAISYSKLGTLWQQKGDFNQALAFFEKDAKLTEELYQANPHNENLGYGLCIAYERLGDLWKSKGDFDQALDFFEKLNELIQKLHFANPHHEQIKNELAISYEKLGNLWQEKSDFNQAFAFFEKETTLFEELYRANPHNENLKNGLSVSYFKLGDLWRAQGDLEKAKAYLEKDLQLTEAIAAANPNSFNWQNNLRISYQNVASLYEDLERPSEALAFYKKAEAILSVLWEQTKLDSLRESLDNVSERIASL